MGELLWWHRAGQKVVCLDSAPWPTSYVFAPTELEEGAIYTVREVRIAHNKVGRFEPAFKLVEVRDPNNYAARRFRPVRETSIDCFRHLLNPTPDKVRELEDVDA